MPKKNSGEFEYRKKRTFMERSAEAEKIISRHPDRLPIIVEKKGDDKNIPKIDKSKFLVPLDLSFGQFVYVVRKRIELPPTQSLFLFVDGILPRTSDSIIDLYTKYKHLDGFLYISYCGENTFG